MTRKSADNSPLSGTRFQTFSETTSGNMETQMGKSVTIEVNRGLVEDHNSYKNAGDSCRWMWQIV